MSAAPIRRAAVLAASLLAAVLALPLRAEEGKGSEEENKRPVEVELKKAWTEGREKAAVFGDINIVAEIANNTPEGISWVLLDVDPFDKDGKPLDLRFRPLGMEPDHPGVKVAATGTPELPYELVPGWREVVELKDGLPAGGKREVTLKLQAPVAFGSIKSLALSVVAHGGSDFVLNLLGSPLIPPAKREESAKRVSQERGRAYRFVTDGGDWKLPAGLESLEPIPLAEQSPAGGGITFERTAIPDSGAVVEVANDADRTIAVTVLGQGTSRTLSLAAGSRQEMRFEAGTYSFTATASGCYPHSGVKSWDAGSRYTWKFWIR